MTPPAAAAAPAVRPRRPAAPGRPHKAPARPRRISGPAPASPATSPARRRRSADGGLALGALGLLDRVASHRLLDRLIRGRASIALVAFALIGIVTLQLGLLQLNSSIGRTLERESVLQRENSALSIENSEMAAGERVEARATQLGMALVPVAAFRFLSARPGVDAARAVVALRASAHSSGAEASEAGGAGGSTQASAAAAQGGAEQTATTPSEASSSSEPSSAAGQATQSSGEQASTPASSSTQAPAAAAPPAAGPSGGGSTEATPAGGTQAGPTG